MDKIRLMTILVGVLLVVTSCGIMEKTSESAAVGRSEKVKEEAMSPEKMEQLMNTWNSDIAGDGKSLYFENGEITVRDDPRDLPGTTMDFSTGYLRKITASEWHVNIPIHGENILDNHTNDSSVTESNSFSYEESARYYAIEHVQELDSKIQVLDKTNSLADITNTDTVAESLKTHYICDKLYRGFIDVNGKTNAGFIQLLHDEFDHSYMITVAGTGNLSEIEYDAEQVFSTFMIDFNLDEWIENNK